MYKSLIIAIVLLIAGFAFEHHMPQSSFHFIPWFAGMLYMMDFGIKLDIKITEKQREKHENNY